MKRNTMLLAAALVAVPAAAFAAPTPYEQQLAQQEEARILRSPIGGVRNSRWFDYRTNINETRKELASDLRRSSDAEDRRDAWDEYGTELRHERVSYVKAMAKKGYRVGRVYVGDY
jgi:hypothetical protein